jgi:hypothetical protein
MMQLGECILEKLVVMPSISKILKKDIQYNYFVIVLYVCEAQSLTLEEEHKLQKSENKVLRGSA